MSVIPSFTLKLQRAYEHLDSFKHEADAWVRADPYGIVDEPDPEPPPQPIGDNCQARRIRINRVSDVPERLSVIMGDCLFNMRCALDHLALTLAKSHAVSMTDEQVIGSEFPIFSSSAGYRKHAPKKIGCLEQSAQAIIESLQPYHCPSGYAAHPLWQLHELNRVDKHRALTVCGADPRKDGARILSLPMDGFTNWAGAYVYWLGANRFTFELDAIWVRWAPMAADPDQEVSVQPEFPVEIVFGQGGPTALEPVIETLRRLGEFVSDPVIAQLSKFL